MRQSADCKYSFERFDDNGLTGSARLDYEDKVQRVFMLIGYRSIYETLKEMGYRNTYEEIYESNFVDAMHHIQVQNINR